MKTYPNWLSPDDYSKYDLCNICFGFGGHTLDFYPIIGVRKIDKTKPCEKCNRTYRKGLDK